MNVLKHVKKQPKSTIYIRQGDINSEQALKHETICQSGSIYLNTWAYACMVSRSSLAVKRQYSVRVKSSDRVPPGAGEKKKKKGYEIEGKLFISIPAHWNSHKWLLTQHSSSHQDVEERLSIPAVVELGARGIKELCNRFQISASLVQALNNTFLKLSRVKSLLFICGETRVLKWVALCVRLFFFKQGSSLGQGF